MEKFEKVTFGHHNQEEWDTTIFQIEKEYSLLKM
jgi:hypothetical protein